MAYQPLQRPASITVLLDSGLSLFVATLQRSLPLSMVLGLLAVLPLVGGGSGVDVVDGHSIAVQQNSALRTLLNLLATFANFIVTSLLVVLIYRYSEDRSQSYGEAWQRVLQNWLSIILTLFGYLFMIMFAMMFFILPALYPYITFMFAIFFVVLHHDGPFAAFRKSFDLLRENWWRSLGLMLIVTSMMMALLIVLISLFNVQVRPGDLYNSQTSMGFYILLVVLLSLFTPLLTAMQVVLYRDLQLRKAEFNLDYE